MAVTFATAAAAPLGTPDEVWIALLVVSVLLVIIAIRQHWREGKATPAPPSVPAQQATRPVWRGFPAGIERAIIESLIAAEDLTRERSVKGDRWFVDALTKWAGDTHDRLSKEEPGELLDAFADDGIDPPHSMAEHDAYLQRRIEILEKALEQLRSQS